MLMLYIPNVYANANGAHDEDTRVYAGCERATTTKTTRNINDL